MVQENSECLSGLSGCSWKAVLYVSAFFKRKIQSESGGKFMEEIIKNATMAAKHDGYNQVVISCDDGTFSFCHEAAGKPTVSIFNDEHIIGHVIVFWKNGVLNTRYCNI